MPGDLSRRRFLAGLLGGAATVALSATPALAQRAVKAGTQTPLGLTIIPRSIWDPHGTCRPARAPRYGPPIRRAVVHHTVRYRRYSKREAPEIVRRLCRFHIEARGFDDVGYHFLIDRYGHAYEGRLGGMEQPVVGAHSEGHNDGTFGVALVGDFQQDRVPEPALRTLERLLAWKLSLHEVPPRGRDPDRRWQEGLTVTPVSHGGGGPTIIGHRDTKATLCPGRHLYRAMAGIERRVAAMMRRGVVMQPATAHVRTALPGGDQAIRAAREPQAMPRVEQDVGGFGSLPGEQGAAALGLGLTGLGLGLSGNLRRDTDEPGRGTA